jgi:hypothetical protein
MEERECHVVGRIAQNSSGTGQGTVADVLNMVTEFLIPYNQIVKIL